MITSLQSLPLFYKYRLFLLFPSASKNRAAFLLGLGHLPHLGLCQKGSSACSGASLRGHVVLEKEVSCLGAKVAALLI